MSTAFLEIEHKFVVAPDYDPTAFFARVRSAKPLKEYETSVFDTYYLLKDVPNLVYRHRFDGMIQHLTAKSVGGDSEARLEVNLSLDLTGGTQNEAVARFLQTFGIEWTGAIHKKVQVFYFDTVEVVFYQASFGLKKVACIEIEVRHPDSLEAARELLFAWEERLGLVPKDRSNLSLLHLLILDSLPPSLRDKLASMS